MSNSSNGRIRALIISADGFEDPELVEPLARLGDEGMAIDIASLRRGTIKGRKGATVEATLTVREADPDAYDVLILPGGRAPAKLRTHAEVLDFVRRFFTTGRPVAAICHGPQILAAAGLLQGRTATGYHAIAGELREAGAHYVDEPVVVDGQLITSRQPADIPEFVDAIVKATGL